jgi:hypothetical protein
MPSDRSQLNVRLDDEGHAILHALTGHLGLTQAGVLEVLLRDAARTYRLPVARLVADYQAARTLRQRSRRKRGKAGGR